MPPKKPRGPLTDEEKRQQDQQFEKDLNKLSRQCSIYEKDRMHQAFAKSSALARDDKIQNILLNELKDVTLDLNIATTKEKKVDDAKTMAEIALEIDEYSEYLEQVETSRKQTAEIEGQIKMAMKRVLLLRSKQTTDRQHEDRVFNAMKTLEKLENSLDLQVKKFCGICWKNKGLREEIQHLCKIRASFMVNWDMFIEKLANGKQILLDLIEQATLAFDEREEWYMKLKVLKIKAAQDYTRNRQTVDELDRRNDHNVKLQDFFLVKGQIRNMKMLRKRERIQRLKKEKLLQDQLKVYEDNLLDITQFVGETEIEIIARKFQASEEENFTNFRYINDLTKEIEDVSYALGLLHIDIDGRRTLHDTRLEQQKVKLNEIEFSLGEHVTIRKQDEIHFKQINDELNQMMNGIYNLFKLARCHNDPLVNLLGQNMQIKWYNVLLYLQILEKTVSWNLVKACHRDGSRRRSSASRTRRLLEDDPLEPRIYSIEALVEQDPCPLCVERDVVTDVVDKVQCVWSRETVKKKLEHVRKQPEGVNCLHRVSKCMLPKARAIIQRRLYQ